MSATKIAELPDEAFHREAEARMKTFSYVRPADGYVHGKAMALLGRTDIVKGVVQVVKQGGENNLHYHSKIDSFWFVLKGRVRFYGPGDVLIGEFGPHEGMITPRGARYWFESVGEDELELLQVAAYADPDATNSGRIDASARKTPHRNME